MKAFLHRFLRALRTIALIVVCALALFISSVAHAILDTNANLMSDLWEKQHNNGVVFPATFLATADDDNDGWTNATEAIAGTDPFQPNPPNGIIATTIEPTGTEGTFTLTWPTIIGKNYRLQASSNLTDWLNVGTAIVGTTNSHTLGISAVQPDTTVPPKLFWRIVVTDLDADGDGLTNAEENDLGTDPNNADTDGDGYADLAELLLYLNPNDPDTDGDGSSDSQERYSGTDPNSKLSHPAVWKSIERRLQYDFADYPIEQGGRQGQLDTFGFWSLAQSYTSYLTEEIPWTTFDDELASHTPYSNSIPIDFDINNFTCSGQAEFMINPPCYHASLEQQKFWLDVSPALSYDISKKVIIVTERVINTIQSAVVTQIVDVNITAGNNTSAPVEVNPAFTTVPTLNLPQKENVKMSLLPMEVNCQELYTFYGHKNDKVDLCHVSGVTCQWRLKTASPNIGWFNNANDSKCSFIPSGVGKNTIQLLIGNVVVWEKDVEVIDIITRSAWGAQPSNSHSQTIPDIQHVTLHHTSNVATGTSEMVRIQNMHMSNWPYSVFGGKDFDDIGYHLIMDKSGVVYEGRQIESAPGKPDGPYTKGEHVGSNNTVAGFGLCTMGDYESSEGNEAWPASRQKSIEKVTSAVCRRYKIGFEKISYHKDMALSTSPSLCPGSNYITTIPTIITNVRDNLK